jgi:hypothetical protein
MGVLTAPLALIKVNGITIGKMKNIRCTETYRRGRVSGLGQLVSEELPALEWNGTLTCQFYSVSFHKTGLPEGIKRRAPSIQAFVDNVLLQEGGVDVTIMKKIKDTIDPTTGLIVATYEEYATITGCFLDRESFDISEGQISGQDQDFSYLTPIIYDI